MTEAIGGYEFVYHGSIIADISVLEPRKCFVPGGADVPPRVYASANPIFSAMHSFPWSSEDGIDIDIENENLTLLVPKEHAQRLNQRVYIYRLPGDSFSLTSEEESGETVHSNESVAPLDVTTFDSVVSAVEYYGGKVKFV